MEGEQSLAQAADQQEHPGQLGAAHHLQGAKVRHAQAARQQRRQHDAPRLHQRAAQPVQQGVPKKGSLFHAVPPLFRCQRLARSASSRPKNERSSAAPVTPARWACDRARAASPPEGQKRKNEGKGLWMRPVRPEKMGRGKRESVMAVIREVGADRSLIAVCEEYGKATARQAGCRSDSVSFDGEGNKTIIHKAHLDTPLKGSPRRGPFDAHLGAAKVPAQPTPRNRGRRETAKDRPSRPAGRRSVPAEPPCPSQARGVEAVPSADSRAPALPRPSRFAVTGRAAAISSGMSDRPSSIHASTYPKRGSCRGCRRPERRRSSRTVAGHGDGARRSGPPQPRPVAAPAPLLRRGRRDISTPQWI